MFRGSSDRPIQPVEIVLTLAHAHHVDSGLLRQGEVGVPA
jgi:hypothetical protein